MAIKLARTKHAVVNTERVEAEYNGAAIRSVRIGDADVDNGTVWKLGAKESGQREIHTLVAATAGTDKAADKALVLLCTPEVGAANYDERLDTLADFYNVAGSVGRAIILQPQEDTYAVTVEAFANPTDAAPGKFVETTSNGKVKAVTAKTNAFGEIIDFVNGKYGIHVL